MPHLSASTISRRSIPASVLSPVASRKRRRASTSSGEAAEAEAEKAPQVTSHAHAG